MLLYVVGAPSASLEALWVFFTFVVELDVGAQVTFLGHPRCCLLAELILEIICEGYCFIIDSSIGNGF